ncbi:hypothetical protein [Fictibacillus sp. S7]|uniref:hypothetical protein n=1 Tax=Fictibacillus sp. S7 TaxID=2212476 RepID=UPI00267B6A12
MNVKIINRMLAVHEFNIIGVSISSVLLIGDAESISAGSTFDTPPTSLVVGPLLVPIQGTLEPASQSTAPPETGASVPLTPAPPAAAPPSGGTAPPAPSAGSGGAPART